jgi:hypothetical protein
LKEKIKDIRNAIDNECFLSALALALTLPDVCGKVEFLKEVGRKVYIDWFDKYVLPYYQDDSEYDNEYEGTQFDGKACYSLRCAYLHSGNMDIENGKLRVKINQFDLCISSTKDSGIYVDKCGVITSNYSDEIVYSVRLDVRKLCKTLCDAAEKYFKNHQNKGMFKEHEIHIINMEEEMFRLNPNYKPISAEELQIALEELKKQ